MTVRRAITTRYAEVADAEVICDVLVRSIREVCGPDYGNDAALLERWCGNKKPEIMRAYILDPANRTIVALVDDRVVGVAQITVGSEIRICYALPEVIGNGVGHALLMRLEEIAGELAVPRMVLTSTSTALHFYERHGFEPSGPPEPRGPGHQYPLSKTLSSG